MALRKKRSSIEPEILPAVDTHALGSDGAEELQDSLPIEALVPEVIDDDALDFLEPEISIDDDTTVDSIPEEKAIVAKDYYPSRQNPLDIYLREVNRIPPISREEEKALALRYVEQKDMAAAKSLIQANLWLVVKIARDYQNAAKNLLDLIQEGNMGLMEAVKHFDPLREVRLPSYAAWWIKAYIVRYLIANFRMVKIGTTQAQRKLFFNLKKEKEKLERQGFFPAPKLLAEKLQVRESDVIEMEQRMGSSDMSVDTPLHDNPDSDMLSVLPNHQESAEDLLADHETITNLRNNFDQFEKSLNDKEKIIFRKRLLSEEKAKLQ